MKSVLWTHPANPSAAIDHMEVTLDRLSAESLELRYVLTGRIGEILVPPPAPSLRTDNLWKTTCFEIFLAAAGSPAYRELNFSPSSEWAAYDFTGYRTGMVQAPVHAPPEIRVDRSSDRLVVTVSLRIDLVAESHCVGLAAVVQERAGITSYWALSHPSDAPDFHRRDCFVLKLPPPTPQ